MRARIQLLGRVSCGMAMAEYAVIGTLVLLVCIVGFLSAGKNLRDWFTSLHGEMSQQAQKTQATQLAVAQAQVVQAKYQEAMKTAGAWHANSTDPNALCNTDFCIDAPGLSGTVISTAGGNGSTSITHSASDIYGQIAQKLQETGADPATVDLLTRMANQGHSLGDMQSSLSTKPGYTAFKNDIDGIQSGLSNFKQMSQQLNASMGSYPPEVRAVLDDATRVVIGVGDSYTFQASPDGTIGYNFAPQNIELTHTKSNTICDNGGDQSQCHR